MARMLDLIRSSQVPSNLMQFAARGALAVPPEETIEILVYLALHNRLFGEQARLTLAGWDEKASLSAAADPNTSAEVLKYLVAPQNLRPCLLPALTENQSISEELLDELAVSGSRSVVEVLLLSPRVMGSRRLLEALQSNGRVRPNENAEIGKKLAALEAGPTAEVAKEQVPEGEVVAPGVAEAEVAEADTPDEVIESTVTKYLEENALELVAENDKPFQAIGLSHEGADVEVVSEVGAQATTAFADATESGDGTVAVAEKSAASVVVKARKSALSPQEARRDSPLQKISKLDIRGRISLAMRGNKEDRSILIRDSTKLVAIAVLESPKITDGEVEAFALQKNVLEAVLRAIPMKRRFAKNYNIMRNLVQNPRTPLDLSLGLMKNLLIRDLKNLSGNKEVADTIRKVATRMFKQKLEKKG
jgi:hypothetical protein